MNIKLAGESNNRDTAMLDRTFGPSGSNGTVITDFGGNDAGLSVGVESDGKLLVAGYAFSTSARNFAIARYSSKGVLVRVIIYLTNPAYPLQ